MVSCNQLPVPVGTRRGMCSGGERVPVHLLVARPNAPLLYPTQCFRTRTDEMMGDVRSYDGVRCSSVRAQSQTGFNDYGRSPSSPSTTPKTRGSFLKRQYQHPSVQLNKKMHAKSVDGGDIQCGLAGSSWRCGHHTGNVGHHRESTIKYINHCCCERLRVIFSSFSFFFFSSCVVRSG